jgi:ribosomal RNA-processing protein 9
MYLFQLEQAGKLHRQIAKEYIPPSTDNIKVLRGHKLPITCLVITPDAKHVFTGSKDFNLIKCKLIDFEWLGLLTQ